MVATSELITYLKKLVGKYEKVEGIRAFPVFDDHIFKPSIEVDDNVSIITFSNSVYILKLSAEGCDIYVNFDRNITNDEYTIIWNGTTKVIGRKTKTIYCKAPSGLSGILRLEGLMLNA